MNGDRYVGLVQERVRTGDHPEKNNGWTMALDAPHAYRSTAAVVILALGCWLALGCGGESEYKAVDLSATVAVASPNYPASAELPHRLRVAVAAMISPKETLAYYKELLAYIGSRVGYEVQLVQRRTYGEINEMFPKREVDLAFICTGPYALGRELYGFEALATPIVRGQPFYQSYLLVNKDSPFQRLEDLRGHRFAFTDPDSNTGTLVPQWWLAALGERPETFFGTVTYTYSHDNSILAVARNLVDGAAVDGHQWEYFQRRNPVYTSQTRVIRKSEPFGSPPLVASVFLEPGLKTAIRGELMGMHEDPEGRRILGELLIDRFEGPQEDWYRNVRRMVDDLRQVHHVAPAP
jgi:phosphonate transport system substrate-binding protein